VAARLTGKVGDCAANATETRSRATALIDSLPPIGH
jgi:hypothetical protein